jgi:hypothetical protein
MVAPEVVLLTFLVARFFVVPAAQDVGELVKKTLGRVPAWRAGPKVGGQRDPPPAHFLRTRLAAYSTVAHIAGNPR